MFERLDGILVPEQALVDACQRIVDLKAELAERDRRIAELEAEVKVHRTNSYAAAGAAGCAPHDVPIRIANLESLLPQAFDAGVAYGIASHRDFEQVHPDRDAWVREALGKDEEMR